MLLSAEQRAAERAAQQLKDNPKDEEEIQRQFNSVWSGWVTELTADTKRVEDINLEEDQLIILRELGFEPALIDECKRSGRYKKISNVGDYSVNMMKSNNLVIVFFSKTYFKMPFPP